MHQPSPSSLPPTHAVSRRTFVSGALAAGGALSATSLLAADAAQPQTAKPAPPKITRKLKVGLIGCGGRGQWLVPFLMKHGGYELHAVADYFPEVADAAGEKFAVAKARRFSGLAGYKKLLQSGVEAVFIEDVPYFYAEQAKDAVEAGLHVYMAKPVAVDVPGCLAIGAAGREATQKKLCFLVDYQFPHAPAMVEVARRLRKGAIGKLAHVLSIGFGWQGWPDPPLGKTLDSRFRNEIWLSDTALSGDTIVSYDIHVIDGLLWLLGMRPTSACGLSGICRANPHGDRTDCAGVVYQFDDGTLWTHSTQSITDNFEASATTLSASFFGLKATAHIEYGGKVYIRGGDDHYSGTCGSIYDEGVICNVADFYKNIIEGRCENPSVQRAVDGTLTAILGREAAARRHYLTMQELIQENKRLEVDLTGLKV